MKKIIWTSNIKEIALFFQMIGNFNNIQYFITKMEYWDKYTIKTSFDKRVMYFSTIEEAQKWCQEDINKLN